MHVLPTLIVLFCFFEKRKKADVFNVSDYHLRQKQQGEDGGRRLRRDKNNHFRRSGKKPTLTLLGWCNHSSITYIFRFLFSFLLNAVFLLQVILNALFFNYDVEKAVLDPRLHNQLSPNTTQAEPEFDEVSVPKNTFHQRFVCANKKKEDGGANSSASSSYSPGCVCIM